MRPRVVEVRARGAAFAKEYAPITEIEFVEDRAGDGRRRGGLCTDGADGLPHTLVELYDRIVDGSVDVGGLETDRRQSRSVEASTAAPAG